MAKGCESKNFGRILRLNEANEIKLRFAEERIGKLTMPLEVRTKEELLRYAQNASECRVVYGKDKAKVKFRTLRKLVVLKIGPEEVKDLTKEIKAPIIEIGTKPEIA